MTERRTAVDFAHQMKWLVDEAYPSAESVRVVLDNLNTHKLSLYDAFEPLEAGAPPSVWSSTTLQYTAVGSAEIELSVFSLVVCDSVSRMRLT